MTNATPLPPLKGLTEFTVLCAVAGIGFFAAGVLGFASAVIGTEYATDAELAWKVALGAIANFALVLAMTSTIGAIVLSGVRHLLHRVRTGAPL